MEEQAMNCAKCGGKLRVTGSTHRYTESGLPYVVLHGVQVRKCQECGEEEVAIPNISGLHRCIAAILVARKAALAAMEFRFLRQFLGHSSKDFAKTLGVTPETLSRWEHAGRDIPPVVDRIVRLLVVNTPPRTDYSADMLAKIRPAPLKHARMALRLSGSDWEADRAA
jgi:putative zinc finger/helix-turn-helix YgiT family protein